MIKILLLSILVLLMNPVHADSKTGLITKKSKHSVSETLDRLSNVLKKKGIKIFARISHDENAEGVGIKLRPTELLIFAVNA